MRSKIITVLISLLVLLSVVNPLLKTTIPGTADGFAHKFRTVDFISSIHEGHLRPRWLGAQALGFGAPIFLFNYLPPYYLISGFHLLGLTVNTSTEVYEALTIIGSFITMFLLAKVLWGAKAGLVAATVYALAPYHLLTIYLYEGWGEMGTFVFPPLILYLTVKLLVVRFNRQNSIAQNSNLKTQNQSLKLITHDLQFLFLILSWFFLILTHNVSALIFTPVLLCLTFVLSKLNFRLFLPVLGSFLLAVLLSAFFWLPAIVLNNETRYPILIAQEMSMRGSYFKSLATLITVAYTTIFTGSTWYYDFTIGMPIFLAVILGCIMIVKIILPYILICMKKLSVRRAGPAPRVSQRYAPSSRETGWAQTRWSYGWEALSRVTRSNTLLIIIFFFFFLGLYLVNYSSSWFWEWIKPLNYIVYPFRFLFLATFAGSLIAGWVVRKNVVLAAIFIIISVIAAYPYTKPAIDQFPFDDKYFQNGQTIMHAPGTKKNMATIEFLPRWADLTFLTNDVEPQFFATGKLPEKFILPPGSGEIGDSHVGVEEMGVKVSLSEPARLTVNSFYFPNWQARVDGKYTQIDRDRQGRITLDLAKGEHTVHFQFGKSRVEKLADIISLLGLVMFVFVLFRIKKPKQTA